MNFLQVNLFFLITFLAFNGKTSKQNVVPQSEEELPAKSFKGTFGRVSDYLMERVATNDPQANLASVIERLESRQVGDLEKTVLRKILKVAGVSDKCDQASYAVLMDNDQITENGQHGLRFRKVPTKRIDQLFNFYCTKHAIKCQHIILKNFKAKYPLIDEEVRHRVATWMDAVSELHASELKSHERPGSQLEQLFNGIIRTKGHIREISNVKPAYEAIVSLTKENNSKQNQLPDASEVNNLFKELLLDSCNNYVQQLGPDVFERANFDLSFHYNLDPEEPEFYHAWSRYQLCTSLKLKFDWMYTFLSPSGMLADYARFRAARQI